MDSTNRPDVERYLLADWETIAREHGPMAFNTAWRILGHVQDSEDAVQEALLDALRIFRADQVSNWGGLLRHLATCRALDRLRGHPPSQPLVAETLSPVASQPENVAIERELARRLRTAVVKLPHRQASVFSLRYFGEMSNSEIAETLQIRVDAVAVALHKARAKLKRLLDVEETHPARKKS